MREVRLRLTARRPSPQYTFELAMKESSSASRTRFAGRARAIVPLLAAASAACVLSLMGPRSFYYWDHDRDFGRVARLLHGDLAVLRTGQLQAGGGVQTLSGLFYAVLAPFMAISSDLRWLYGAIDALVLLGAIPAYRVARLFFGWDGAALFALLWLLDNGRVMLSNEGWHASLLLLAAPGWHLAALYQLRAPSRGSWLAMALLTFANLSLHLSFAPLVLGYAILLARFRAPSTWRWLYPSLLALIPFVGGAIAFLRGRLAFAFFGLPLARTLDLLIGFDTNTWSWGGLAAAHSAWQWPVYFVTLLGMIVVATRTFVFDEQGLFRAWLLSMSAAHLGALWIGFAFYEHRTALIDRRCSGGWFLPALMAFHCGLLWLGRRFWPRRPWFAVGLALTLHLVVLSRRRWTAPATAFAVGPPDAAAVNSSGRAAAPSSYEALAQAMRTWGVDAEWLYYHSYTDRLETGVSLMPFYLGWLQRENGGRAAHAAHLDSFRLVFVPLTSRLAEQLSSVCQQRFDRFGLRACLLNAEEMPANLVRFVRDPGKWRLSTGDLHVERSPAGGLRHLLASRETPPPEALAELSYDATVSDSADGLRLSATMFGTSLTLAPHDDTLVSSDLLLLDAGGATLARLSFLPIAASETVIGGGTPRGALTATLTGLRAASVGDVRLELVYLDLDPNHSRSARRFGWSMMAPGLGSDAPLELEELGEPWSIFQKLRRAVRRRVGLQSNPLIVPAKMSFGASILGTNDQATRKEPKRKSDER